MHRGLPYLIHVKDLGMPLVAGSFSAAHVFLHQDLLRWIFRTKRTTKSAGYEVGTKFENVLPIIYRDIPHFESFILF